MEPMIPKIRDVRVVAAQPLAADARKLDYLRQNDVAVPVNAVYLVKVYLDKVEQPRGLGLGLYVGDERIPKYSGFVGGVYFDVHDPNFLKRHAGDKILFETPSELVDSGARLPGIDQLAPQADAVSKLALPSRIDALRK